jgi:hypothetical protein
MNACMNWVPVVLHGAPRRCDGWCHESVMFCSVLFCSVQFSSVQFSSRVCQYTFTLISLNLSADARERIRAAVKVKVRSIMMVLLMMMCCVFRNFYGMSCKPRKEGLQASDTFRWNEKEQSRKKILLVEST